MAVLQVLSNDEEMFTICSLNMLQARVSLLDLMNKYDGKILEKDVNCYTQMMLEGLLGVHEKGFIHSDLQPGNILNFPPQHCASLPTLNSG
ncbi:hypothetical protein Gotri_013334 [Gossypium trilobum]|uniref:Protein kinase domain-containing protein n=1 Tax=Gossypium trilobum TaxID=34281 RepID=A0A7J9DTC6_9ROSI|nr:hypothetical protein [Gossypium trilobum]